MGRAAPGDGGWSGWGWGWFVAAPLLLGGDQAAARKTVSTARPMPALAGR